MRDSETSRSKVRPNEREHAPGGHIINSMQIAAVVRLVAAANERKGVESSVRVGSRSVVICIGQLRGPRGRLR